MKAPRRKQDVTVEYILDAPFSELSEVLTDLFYVEVPIIETVADLKKARGAFRAANDSYNILASLLPLLNERKRYLTRIKAEREDKDELVSRADIVEAHMNIAKQNWTTISRLLSVLDMEIRASVHQT